jgi:amino acid adenylation domain-containing protein
LKTELQRLYWMNELSNSPPETTLFKNQRQAQKFLPQSFRFDLPALLSNELVQLARNSDLSLYLILLSALTVLIYKYTNREDLLIGSLPYRSDGHVIPLRLAVKGARSIQMQLRDVRRRVLRAYLNQDYAVESFSGLSLAFENHRSLNGDLTLRFSSPPLRGRAIFNANVFNEPTIKHVIDNYISVLESVTRSPTVAIDDLSLITATEERRLLVEFSQGAERDISDKLMHRGFEAQAQKTPAAIAVTCEDESLTYAELNALANRLARGLQRSGVRPETIVAVLARRGVNLLIAMLALFKCGGVYLPLDPQQPLSRLTQLIVDSKSSLILATAEFRDRLAQATGNHERVFIEELLSQPESEENLSENCDPTNLSYVIYTSGSTGAPKGAMLEHRGMFNHLDAKVSELGLSSADVVAQTASQCFDVSVWQFLAVLLAGGQVRIIRDDVVREPSQLLEQVVGEGVSVLEVVPSQLRAILQTIELAGSPVGLPTLRFLLVTGEVLPPSLCRQWFDLFSSLPLVNAYGPTECSDDVTHHLIRSSPAPDSVETPIGRPVQNLQVYVLGHGLKPVPIGIPGEIYVGGTGVGRGYLHDAKRTAEVYLPDPFSCKPGARLYYTGDLGCYLPDGSIQFAGRCDQQVKLRGFRIELGEIEAVLRAHPAIDDAAVVALGDGRLVAYGAAPRGVTKKDLRQFIRSRLPEHMIPSHLVILNALPLNTNGKIDRHSLPSPELVADQRDDDLLPPTTSVEKALANIWAKNLRVNAVSLHDNFFELGGNSLLSIQVLNLIRAALNIDLPMKVLLESPSLGDLADKVSSMVPTDIPDQCQNNGIASVTQP